MWRNGLTKGMYKRDALMRRNGNFSANTESSERRLGLRIIKLPRRKLVRDLHP